MTIVKNALNRARSGLLNVRNVGLSLAALAVVSSAQAEVDATITTLVTDVTSTFGTVKTAILGIVGFFLLLWIVKKVRRA